MGRAREVMDQITDAVIHADADALRRLYADDAVADSPDVGRIEGGAAIVEYVMALRRAVPDLTWEARNQYETEDTAVDEGWLVGTHTEPLASPEGEIPPTGRPLRLRECDVLTVRGGRAVEHHFYFDQMEFAVQLGLVSTGADAAAVPEPRTSADQADRTRAR
ncbi:ester cyclase [Geodermatophilus sp. SYSU D00703]